MGLDMYLYASQSFYATKYLSCEQTDRQKQDCENTKQVAEMMGGMEFLETGDSFFQPCKVRLQIAYWRKANQIHKYFVDQCARGKDECQDTYVEREQLEDLLNRCRTILEDHSKAEELLPSQSGFFFGSTEYDDWYFKDLEDTVPILEKILKDAPEDWDFIYQASW
jgi:hypothetical protein